jgi:drug/metabolite transporter (DMT)-like permease
LTQRRYFPYLVLLFGVLVAATSSIFIRLAQGSGEGAPSMVVASWRLIIAAFILTPIAWRQRGDELRALRGQDVSWGLAAGLLLAMHLVTWTSSLAFTSVASSAALVATNPLWIALVVFFFFGEHLSRNTVTGLAAAFIGSILIAFSDGQILMLDPAASPVIQFNWQNLIAPAGKADTALLGDGLALMGAITVAGYLLVGRNLRLRLSNIAYVWVVYTAAMVATVVITLSSGFTLFGYSWMVYFWLLLLGIGPQLLGHTAFNWALAHLSATFVALSILGEPVGSAILAYFIFGETFASLQLAGFVLLLVGIGMGILGEQKRKG